MLKVYRQREPDCSQEMPAKELYGSRYIAIPFSVTAFKSQDLTVLYVFISINKIVVIDLRTNVTVKINGSKDNGDVHA